MATNRKKFRKTNRGHYEKKFTPYPFFKNEELIVEIDNISHLGHGVARVDHSPATGEPVLNWVIFVPFALPNETVKVAITDNSKSSSHAKIVEVITPSPHRVEPKCKHFFYCGGCQFQHLEYSEQLKVRADQTRELLHRLAGIEHPVNAPIASPQQWNYRSKITPHYKKPEKGVIKAIGFHHFSEKNQIVDLHECAIAMEQLNQALPAIKKNTKGRARTIKKDGNLLMRVSEDSVETSPTNVVCEHVGDLTFRFLAGDFFQNNPYVLEDFTNYVASQAKGETINYLVDTYCGCGLFSLTLAKHFDKVLGVEVSATSADWARHNAKENKIDNAEFHSSRAEHIFDKISFPADQTAIVIDPPRAGCTPEFLEQLFAYGPQKVVYVSCDPSTQMRDLQAFNEHNYAVSAIQPIDLFPHTRHLECVVTLERS